MVSIALLCLATGQSYWQFIAPFLQSAKLFFPPADVFLFTDAKKQYVEHQFPAPALGYPQATLHRYRTFLAQRDWLSRYSHVFYSDIDDLFVAPISEADIVAEGITATVHSCFHNRPASTRTYELNPKSTAYMTASEHYFGGGFVGGSSQAFLALMETITRNIATDEANGITAVWHDESHLNRYLLDNPPARVIGPEYHFPEPLWLQISVREACGAFTPKIVCLEKKWKAR